MKIIKRLIVSLKLFWALFNSKEKQSMLNGSLSYGGSTYEPLSTRNIPSELMLDRALTQNTIDALVTARDNYNATRLELEKRLNRNIIGNDKSHFIRVINSTKTNELMLTLMKTREGNHYEIISCELLKIPNLHCITSIHVLRNAMQNPRLLNS